MPKESGHHGPLRTNGAGSAKPRLSRVSIVWIVVVAAVLGALIVGALLGQQLTPPITKADSSAGSATDDSQEGAETGSGSPEPEIDMSRRIEGDPLAIGAADAPVVIVEYADFRCPYCAVVALDTLPVIVDEYVESGHVRIEWRDFPVFGQESTLAAMAARAAAAQGKFWDYHHAVYAIAPERGHADLPRERLLAIAGEVGMPDMAAFEASLDDPAVAALIETDRNEAVSLGATGVPAFLVNDVPIVGAQPLSVFRDTIDEQLARAKR